MFRKILLVLIFLSLLFSCKKSPVKNIGGDAAYDITVSNQIKVPESLRKYYFNGTLLNTMYVTQRRGTFAYTEPTVSSEKTVFLKERTICKICALKNAGTEDDTDWVLILLPRIFWKNGNAEYGWVRGETLSSRIDDLDTEEWKIEDFELYLSNRKWFDETSSVLPKIYDLKSDNTFKIFSDNDTENNNGFWEVENGNDSFSDFELILYHEDDLIEKKLSIRKEEIFEDYFRSGESTYKVYNCYDFIQNGKGEYVISGGTIENLNFLMSVSGMVVSPVRAFRATSSSLWNKENRLFFIMSGLEEDDSDGEGDYISEYNSFWNPIRIEREISSINY